MAPVRFIERPSRALKNSFKTRGESLEIFHSVRFHLNSIPVLISPALLRSRNLGQVDLVKLSKDEAGLLIEVAEVKSSQMGLEFAQREQRLRLMGSGHFICGLLNARLKFTSFVGK